MACTMARADACANYPVAPRASAACRRSAADFIAGPISRRSFSDVMVADKAVQFSTNSVRSLGRSTDVATVVSAG